MTSTATSTSTHPLRRRGRLAAALAAATAAALIPVAHATPVRAAPADPIDCVLATIGQGISLHQAIEDCKLELTFHGVGIGSGGGRIVEMTYTGTDGVPVSSACGTSGADPRLSDDPAGAKQARDDAKRELDEFEKWLATTQPSGKEAFEAAKLQAFLRQRVNDTQNAFNAANTGKRTVEGESKPCDAVEDTLRECSQAGWKTSPCQLLLQQLGDCADMTIAYTDGEPGSGCATPDPDSETVAKTVELLCSMIGRVAPDADPCDPTAGFGFTIIVTDPKEDPCPVDEQGYHSGECPPVEWDPSDIVDLGGGVVIDPRLGGPGAPDGSGDPPREPGDPRRP